MGWSSHTEPLKKLFQEMLSSNELSDVTLVCDDKIRFHSHKLVLSACSPVFQSIISENTLPNQSIFLKGIHSQEMKKKLKLPQDPGIEISKSDQEHKASKSMVPTKMKQEKVIQERINEKCHICGKTFRTMSVYIKHMDKAHFIPCSKCDFKAETQALFIDHIQTTH